MELFSASTRKELLALQSAGAPVLGILREVARILDEPEVFSVALSRTKMNLTDEPMNLTNEERQRIRALKLDPEMVANMTSATRAASGRWRPEPN